MPEPSLKDVEKALQITAEIYNKNLSPAAATMFAADLARFTPKQILAALTKCRMELKFFPSVAEIASRIDDGRPGVEAAWSMIPKDEHGSVVWTQEMAEAFGVARPLLEEGDAIGARMAFKEVYSKLLAEARDRGKRPHWFPSFGFESSGRQAAVIEAVERGRLSQEEALLLLPDQGVRSKVRQIAGGAELRKLEPPKVP